jgi:hypothetical protein
MESFLYDYLSRTTHGDVECFPLVCKPQHHHPPITLWMCDYKLPSQGGSRSLRYFGESLSKSHDRLFRFNSPIPLFTPHTPKRQTKLSPKSVASRSLWATISPRGMLFHGSGTNCFSFATPSRHCPTQTLYVNSRLRFPLVACRYSRSRPHMLSDFGCSCASSADDKLQVLRPPGSTAHINQDVRPRRTTYIIGASDGVPLMSYHSPEVSRL